MNVEDCDMILDDKMIREKLTSLKQLLDKKMAEINNNICLRARKLNIQMLLYFIATKYYSNKSDDVILNDKNNQDLFGKISKGALSKWRSQIDPEFIESINETVLNFIYKDTPKRYIVADGTEISFGFNIHDDEQFKMAKSKTYKKAKVGILFDYEKKIPINYGLYDSNNEREILLNQLYYLKKNDIIIADRGYPSKELIEIFIDRQIDVIFRIPKSWNEVSQFLDEDIQEKIIDLRLSRKVLRVKLISYLVPTIRCSCTSENNNMEIKIVDKQGIYECKCLKNRRNLVQSNKIFIKHVLCTTILDDNKGIEFFKGSYKERWGAEVHIGDIKKLMSLNDIKTKYLTNIRQDILGINLFCILAGYIQFLSTRSKYFNEDSLCENENTINENTINEIHVDKNENTINKNTINEIHVDETDILNNDDNNAADAIDENIIKKISTTNCFNVMASYIINDLYIKKYHYSQINRMLELIKNNICTVIVSYKGDRHYDRVRFKPATKWSKKGNKFAR